MKGVDGGGRTVIIGAEEKFAEKREMKRSREMWKWLLRWEYADCLEGWIYKKGDEIFKKDAIGLLKEFLKYNWFNHNKISPSLIMLLLLVLMRSLRMARVRDGPKCAYELLTLGALSFPLKCCNSAFFVSRDNLQIRDRKTPQIRWLAHLLRICSVFALSTEKRQSDSLGRARLYCDNSQVMALVRFYSAGQPGLTM